ncbi:hypothetical protein COCSUDRAFT_55057 [Coccomyxa subellipsoidea C-169]|uniref:Uncharacterized protein n=1 Tax=Coccomyxa subellipsoidea (strain C-169) TaxID=574566 RepID=I0Z8R1_COCSC|nr:hypothetical protein COCSUDRAFT_55057 [Coccomyxa subellipsoidea C-169]EIE27030.1 hypothetical protein COCSUDRAFT_55057 [Coccomyxa subellipsoidea C-169]|eukprot:XP_005651574.1 hypothetical protein COCSUDRAFT_55057 [Coccomyxa subellipsoidea C-169]
MGKGGSKAIGKAQNATKATNAAAEVKKQSGSKPKNTAKELELEKLVKKREQASKTQRSKIDNDNEGAASDAEPDLQGKDLLGRAKGKPVARKGRQSSAAKGASCAEDDVAMDECDGSGMDYVKQGKKGVKKSAAHGKACAAQESAEDEADDTDDDAEDPDAGEGDSSAQHEEGSEDSDSNSLGGCSSDSDDGDNDDDDDSDEEEPPSHVRAGRKAKGKAPSKQPELRLNRKKIKKGHQGRHELLAAIKSLFEEKSEKKGRKKSTNEEQSTLTPDQRKDIVRYCKEHLAKRSMYPSHAELEKAAKKLAKGEDEKSASFRRAVKKVVSTAMTKQVRGETSKAVKAARTKYYG